MRSLLIADDEPHVTRVLKQSLERQGYQVETVRNGEMALERIYEKLPDVLITDIQMPKMTGEVLCKRIQEEIPQRDFLIFVLTSRTEIEHRDWSRQIDNLQFLEKPVSIRKLINKLESYFTDQQIQASQ
ncbi:MAG: response regulator [Candidatus Thiodiazotropha sp. (ex Codakia rugifera)]|nr:response regulator [Candidatus Thiodiazotropha sp. (ex Codakia rugifera)]